MAFMLYLFWLLQYSTFLESQTPNNNLIVIVYASLFNAFPFKMSQRTMPIHFILIKKRYHWISVYDRTIDCDLFVCCLLNTI